MCDHNRMFVDIFYIVDVYIILNFSGFDKGAFLPLF